MTKRHLLYFSFWLNVLLLAAVLWVARGGSKPQSTLSLLSEETGSTGRPVVRPHCQRPAEAPFESFQTAEQFSWSQLESTDYRSYIARLRAMGCPEPTLRDIILAEVNELYRRRVKDLVGTVQGRFWEVMTAEDELEKLVREKEQELDALKEERDALVDELLGPHTQSLADETAALERSEQRKQFLDFLSADKLAQCLALDERFARLREELAESQPPLPADQSQARSKALQEQQEREFRQMLSPEELAEFDLRNSRFADLRFRLSGFEASEEELREIVRLKTNSNQSPGEQKLSSSEAIRELLGDARFADFERAQDNRFQEISQFTERLELPAQTAADVFEVRKAAEELAKQLRVAGRMSEAEQHMRLQELRSEAEQAVASTLGLQAFETYRQRYGQWLAQLEKQKP